MKKIIRRGAAATLAAVTLGNECGSSCPGGCTKSSGR